MTAARRLAAILAADVVGYSCMMGEDEAGTARLVRERREAAAPALAANDAQARYAELATAQRCDHRAPTPSAELSELRVALLAPTPA